MLDMKQRTKQIRQKYVSMTNVKWVMLRGSETSKCNESNRNVRLWLRSCLTSTRSALESFLERLCEVDKKKIIKKRRRGIKRILLIGVWKSLFHWHDAKLMVVTWEIKNTNAVWVPTHERFKVVIPSLHSSLTTAYSSYSPLTFFSTRRCLCRCMLPVCFSGLCFCLYVCV